MYEIIYQFSMALREYIFNLIDTKRYRRVRADLFYKCSNLIFIDFEDDIELNAVVFKRGTFDRYNPYIFSLSSFCVLNCRKGMSGTAIKVSFYEMSMLRRRMKEVYYNIEFNKIKYREGICMPK